MFFIINLLLFKTKRQLVRGRLPVKGANTHEQQVIVDVLSNLVEKEKERKLSLKEMVCELSRGDECALTVF
jgi:hypothetical protein